MPRVTGDEYRLMLICVDSYEDFVLEGRYYNVSKQNGVYFHSVAELILSIEEMLNHLQYPEAFYRIRSFAKKRFIYDSIPERNWSNRGSLSTFQLKIMFRQNVSWQGTLRWVEGKKEMSFRSVLELISLLDSALQERKHKKEA